jgi:hypothetical protein
MPYARLLKFGTYTLPGGFKVVSIERGRTIGHQKLARATGARQTAGYRNGVRVQVAGGIYRGPMDSSVVRDRQDTLRAALAQGPSRLWLYDDRYYRCMEPEQEPESYLATGFDRMADLQISFLGPDPLMFDVTPGTDVWSGFSSGDTREITVGGNAPAAPLLSITVGGAGAVSLAATITNETTGEAFTLTGDVEGGDVIEVDSLYQTVQIDGADRRDLFDLLFPHLTPGANTLEAEWTSGSISGIVTDWDPRWE